MWVHDNMSMLVLLGLLVPQQQKKFLMLVAVAVFWSLSASAQVSDLSLRIAGNGGSFLPPGQMRDIEVIVRNDGPDTATNIRVMTFEFLISPIGEVWIEPPTEGPACALQYTDFTTPSGQLFFFASFGVPALVPGAESSCRVSIRAIGVGRDSYNVRMGVTDISPDSTDPNFSNNIGSFLFLFNQAIALPMVALPGIAFIVIGVVVLSYRGFYSSR